MTEYGTYWPDAAQRQLRRVLEELADCREKEEAWRRQVERSDGALHDCRERLAELQEEEEIVRESNRLAIQRQKLADMPLDIGTEQQQNKLHEEDEYDDLDMAHLVTGLEYWSQKAARLERKLAAVEAREKEVVQLLGRIPQIASWQNPERPWIEGGSLLLGGVSEAIDMAREKLHSDDHAALDAALETAKGDRDVDWLDCLIGYLDPETAMVDVQFPVATVKAGIDAALADHGCDVLEAAMRVLASEEAKAWDHDLLTEAEGDALERLLGVHRVALEKKQEQVWKKCVEVARKLEDDGRLVTGWQVKQALAEEQSASWT